MRKMHLSAISFALVVTAFSIFPFVFNDQRSNLIFFIIGISILTQLQLKHKEKDFLIRLFDKRFCYFYKILESILVILPILLSLLFHQKWMFAGITFGFIVISHFSVTNSRANPIYNITFFKPNQFEWNSGFRKFFIAFLVIIPLYVYSLFYIPNDIIPFLLVYTMLLLPALFQSTQEEVSFVQIFRCSPTKFLLKKLSYNSIRLFLFGAPLLALTWFLKPNINWLIPVAIFVQNFVYLWISILHKYSFWEESGRFELLNGILFFSSILPFLLPFNLIYLIFARKRAIKNVHPIL